MDNTERITRVKGALVLAADVSDAEGLLFHLKQYIVTRMRRLGVSFKTASVLANVPLEEAESWIEADEKFREEVCALNWSHIKDAVLVADELAASDRILNDVEKLVVAYGAGIYDILSPEDLNKIHGEQQLNGDASPTACAADSTAATLHT